MFDACSGWNFYNGEHFFIQVIESIDPGRCWLLLSNPQHLQIVRDTKKDERGHNKLIQFITDDQYEEKSNHLLQMFDFQDNRYLIADLLPICDPKHFHKLDKKRMLTPCRVLQQFIYYFHVKKELINCKSVEKIFVHVCSFRKQFKKITSQGYL